MRITGGTLKGRPLRAPDGMGTRPTADRVREALFNILSHHDWGEAIGDALDGAVVLDAFAGTGALGIEAISRGAASCTFFEKDRKALTCLKENLRLLDNEVMPVSASLHSPVIPTKVGIQRRASASQKTLMPRGHAALDSDLRRNDNILSDGSIRSLVLPVDVTRPPKATQAATLVFLDPPYHKGLIEAALSGLTAQGWIAPHALLVCETAKDETLALPAPFTIELERLYGDTKLWFACG
ncbi:MAG: RsmD family RNA methyltransferase [Alphaproteobacteria bacterium]|nr:RsmD family RNA methyltransferase [Alphaproteobacteria bacterium]